MQLKKIAYPEIDRVMSVAWRDFERSVEDSIVKGIQKDRIVVRSVTKEKFTVMTNRDEEILDLVNTNFEEQNWKANLESHFGKLIWKSKLES